MGWTKAGTLPASVTTDASVRDLIRGGALTKASLGDEAADPESPLNDAINILIQSLVTELYGPQAIWAEAPRFATPNDALAAATAGSTVVFTQSHTLNGNVYAVPSRVKVRSAPGVVLTQQAWKKPIFDCLDADDVDIDDIKLVSTATRLDILIAPTSFRGDASYLYGAGIWSNGNRGRFTNIRTDGFVCGVNLSAYNSGTGLQDTQKTGNYVDNIDASNVDFGVLTYYQRDITIGVVRADTMVQSPNGGAPHALYVSGTATLRNLRVTVGKIIGNGNLISAIAQFRNCDAISIDTIISTGSAALANFFDYTDLAWNTGIYKDGAGALSALVDFTRVDTTKNTRGEIGKLILNQQNELAATAKQAIGVVGSDIHIGSLLIDTNLTDANSGTCTALLSGDRITVDNFQLHERGFAHRSMWLGPLAVSTDITVRNFKTNKTQRIANVEATATGIVLDYNPADIKGFVAGQQAVAPVNGSTVGYTVARKDYEKAWTLLGSGIGTTQRPEPFLETRTHYKITDNSAFTIPAPGAGAFVGMVHTIRVENASGGALGAATWNAAYTFPVAAWTNPANGATQEVSFRWNGTTWDKFERSAAAATSAGDPAALTSGQMVPSRDLMATNTQAHASGTLALSYFTADKTETVTSLTAYTGTVAAAATPSLCRMGIYSIDSSGNGTLVASTPTDTALFAAANTAYTKALSASYNKIAGQRYALALLVISAATMPNFHGPATAVSGVVSAAQLLAPTNIARLTGQTDLPASFTAGSLTGYQVRSHMLLS